MLQAVILRSIDELRARSAAWDDLWLRSDDTLASSCAEPLAMWLEQFDADRSFRAIVVEEGDRMLAALPLVERPLAGPFHAAALPTNEWPGGGALLWDICNDDPAIGLCLVDALGRLPWSLLLLEGMLTERISLHRFMHALQARRVACDLRTQWHAARLPIDHDWPAMLAQLSRKHRQRMSAARRKLDGFGGASFQRFALADGVALERQLREAFSIEERGWKGAAGTAVLRVPGIFAYTVRLCRTLARSGDAQMALLSAGDTPIAFGLGFVSKGVWHSCKIGYDAAFADATAGHFLHFCLLKELQSDSDCQAIDYMGPITEYHRHWRPRVYPVARLAVAPRGVLGKLALWGYGRFKGPTHAPINERAELLSPVAPALDTAAIADGATFSH